MGTTLPIASRILRAIVAAADGSADEICGLLIGEPGGAVTDHRPCRNVASDPATAFEIDPRALLDAHRTMRAGGAALVGCYHSHPSGIAMPSPRDAAAAAPDGAIWLIVAAGSVSGWRAVANGERHDRFDPVALQPL